MQATYENATAPGKGAVPSVCHFWSTGCRAGTSCRFLHPEKQSSQNKSYNISSASSTPSTSFCTQSRDLSSKQHFSLDEKAISTSAAESGSEVCWDDDRSSIYESRIKASPFLPAVRGRNIVKSLRPLQKPVKQYSQDNPPSNSSSSTELQLSSETRSHVSVHIRGEKIDRNSISLCDRRDNEINYRKNSNDGSRSTRSFVPKSFHSQESLFSRTTQSKTTVSFTHLLCELISADGISDVLPVLASVQGCDLHYVRQRLSLCFTEVYSLLFNQSTWAFLLPQGAVFSFGVEAVSKPRPRPLKSMLTTSTNVYRLFGKPLTPIKNLQSSAVTFVLRSSSENALSVLQFLEEVLCVAFFERDGNSSLAWNRERVSPLSERLKTFFAGGDAMTGYEDFRALTPRHKVDELDSEFKRSTIAALDRIHDESVAPASEIVLPSTGFVQSEDKREPNDSEEDSREENLLIGGTVCSFPGYDLTFDEAHEEHRLIVATLIRNRSSPETPLVLRNHYTALGPEACLQLGEASRVLSSSLLASAGCSHSSQISEALSAQLLLQSFNLRLHHIEMELIYERPSPKIDFTCLASCGTVVGVSVTRAFKGDQIGDLRKFSRQNARTLVAKKVSGLDKAWQSVKCDQQWQYGVLHVWVPCSRNARLVEAAFRDFMSSRAVCTPVMLLITSTTFDCPLAFAYIYNHFS